MYVVRNVFHDIYDGHAVFRSNDQRSKSKAEAQNAP